MLENFMVTLRIGIQSAKNSLLSACRMADTKRNDGMCLVCAHRGGHIRCLRSKLLKGEAKRFFEAQVA